MAKLKKAVFPVAGFGSRFLPVTKASPKEMMPIVDKPLIQYAVEEAVSAGIKDLIFITGRGKRAIEDHFDKAYELEAELQAHGKNKLLKEVRGLLPEGVRCIYIRQPEPLGLGHAVLCAQPAIGEEPFAVILADDLIDADPPAMARLCRPVTKIISVMPAAAASSTAYWMSGLSTIGIISLGLALVTGRNRLPNPATGKTAFLSLAIILP